MASTKAKNAIVIALGIILACGAVAFVDWRGRSAKYHALLAHAYTRNHVTDPAYDAVLENLRTKVWPKEIKLAESKILARQQAADSFNTTTIDLKPYVNAALTDSPASAAGNPGNNLADLPSGLNVYGGVLFDVEGIIQLSGKSLVSVFHKDFPVEVDGIAVHERCAKIHLLHAGDWIDVTDMGKVVAKLVLHYENGTKGQINIVAGRDGFDFWSPLFTTGADPRYSRMSPNTERAWTGSNRYLEQLWPDESLILYKSTYTNSQPDLKVSTVDFVSTMTGTAPFLVGLTVE